MPPVTFLEFGAHEGGVAAGHYRLLEAAAECPEETPVTGKQSGLEHRGTDGHVAAGTVDGLVECACSVSDLETKIPEAIEHAADHRLLTRCCRTGKQEEKIEIRVWREFATSITTDGDKGHAAMTAAALCFQDMGKQLLQH